MAATGQIVGYRRVSSKGQNLARQELPDVTDRVFEEKLSGANRDRPALQEMLSYIRDGDEVHVHSIDRLARSLTDLNNIVTEINSKGASIRFLSEQLHFQGSNDDPVNKLMFHMLGAFSEFEHSLISKRRQEGIEKAKAEGKYKGRKATIDHDLVCDLLARGETAIPKVNAQQIADWLGIGVASVFRIRKARIGEVGDLHDPANTLKQTHPIRTSEELQDLKDRDDAVTKIFYRHGPPTFDTKRVEYLLGLGMGLTEVADAMQIPEDAVLVLCRENLVTD
jgi:DNA invertase Pin-like site-specific DNA recombinase